MPHKQAAIPALRATIAMRSLLAVHFPLYVGAWIMKARQVLRAEVPPGVEELA